MSMSKSLTLVLLLASLQCQCSILDISVDTEITDLEPEYHPKPKPYAKPKYFRPPPKKIIDYKRDNYEIIPIKDDNYNDYEDVHYMNDHYYHGTDLEQQLREGHKVIELNKPPVFIQVSPPKTYLQVHKDDNFYYNYPEYNYHPYE